MFRQLRDASNFRVWRSLVSRLNGVQEAAGSNPVTRTKKKDTACAVSFFLCMGRIRTHLTGTVRRTVPAASSKTGGYLYFLPPEAEENANQIPLNRQIRTIISIRKYADDGFFVDYFDILKYNIHTDKL